MCKAWELRTVSSEELKSNGELMKMNREEGWLRQRCDGVEKTWGMLKEEEGKEPPNFSSPLWWRARDPFPGNTHFCKCPGSLELERWQVTACERPLKHIDIYGMSFHLQAVTANLKLGTKLSTVMLSPPASFPFPPPLLKYKACLSAEIYIASLKATE